MIKRKTIAYELGFENEAYLVGFLKSQQVSVRENSKKKFASKSMIVHFLDSGTLLLQHHYKLKKIK